MLDGSVGPSSACASLWGENSGEGKPWELEENISAMDTQAVLLLPSSLL